MIEGIEISPSDRARCKRCGKKIPEGTPRGVKSEKKSNYTAFSYYCYKCTKIEIEEDIELSKELKKELNKMIKKQNKEIILGEL